MIKVSDINTYHKCPRMCYFRYKGHDLANELSNAYIERLILKELALTYGQAFNSEDKLSFLNNELERISKEIRIVYRIELDKVDDKKIMECISNIGLLIQTICLNLSENDDFFSCEFIQEEPVLRSEKFGLSGSPDRLIKINESILPSIIKTGNMPENGVWSGDRLQLTAYSILVEEKYNLIVEKGFVEYARQGKVRPAVIKRHERRKVLQLIERIKKIRNGFMPERPENAPCMHCAFMSICDVRSTLASRFF